MSATWSEQDLRERIEQFATTVSDVLGMPGDKLERARSYRAALADASLTGLSVPRVYGGQGLPLRSEAIFREVMDERVRTEDAVFGIGLGMVVPTLLQHGSDELCRRFVAPALRGAEIWCQLYSEPGAGSDLAGLSTSAVLDGDEWVVTGQKVWTSGAQHADLGVLLARTDSDAPKRQGISMLIVPMRQPGVDVRPLRQMTGTAEFNEVFLDQARIPRSWVIAEINQGWAMAKALLGHERASLGTGGGRQPASYDDAVELTAAAGSCADASMRQRLAELHSGERIIAWLARRGVHPSIGKLWRSRQGRRAAEVLAHAGGAVATAWEATADAPLPAPVYQILDAPAMAIGGGTDEIQRSTLAEWVLGLPREPAPTARSGDTT